MPPVPPLPPIVLSGIENILRGDPSTHWENFGGSGTSRADVLKRFRLLMVRQVPDIPAYNAQVIDSIINGINSTSGYEDLISQSDREWAMKLIPPPPPPPPPQRGGRRTKRRKNSRKRKGKSRR